MNGENDEGQIRLACSACDRDDYDGVKKLPIGWSNLTKIQSWQESHLRVEGEEPDRSVFRWYTHLGICPDCQREQP
jgi:hypothetical protein